MLEYVKVALRITTDDFDEELKGLINAAKADLHLIANKVSETDPLTKQAIVTYCKCNFGQPDNYDKLKASYDEQKAQMRANPTYKE